VQSLIPNNIITSVSGAATRGQESPLTNFSDTLSWTRGNHALKVGFEARFTHSRGFNGSDNPDFYTIPIVTVGAGQYCGDRDFHDTGPDGLQYHHSAKSVAGLVRLCLRRHRYRTVSMP
jgi:hypothetical protein